MRRLIFQVAVGEVPEFYHDCMLSVMNYARRVGADYQALREPQLLIKPKKSARSANALRLGYLPIFEKLNALRYLGHYDQVAIIDADVFATKYAPNIFDAMGTADFAGVLERDLPLLPKYQKKIINYSRDLLKPLTDVNWHWNELGAQFYNMGVMVLDKSLRNFLNDQPPKEFIERPEFERFVNGEGHWKWSTDQILLNWWIKKERMRCEALDWRWNCLYDYVEPMAVSRMQPYFLHFNLASKMPRGGAEIPEIIRTFQ